MSGRAQAGAADAGDATVKTGFGVALKPAYMTGGFKEVDIAP